jgi:hypothetical protein
MKKDHLLFLHSVSGLSEKKNNDSSLKTDYDKVFFLIQLDPFPLTH